jgi:hypothetical protein
VLEARQVQATGQNEDEAKGGENQDEATTGRENEWFRIGGFLVGRTIAKAPTGPEGSWERVGRFYVCCQMDGLD